jgi:uncharacterized protein YukE
MPTYEEALAADPNAFVQCASEMNAAGTDLTDHQSEYDAKVAEINGCWQDQANTAFNDDVTIVDTHVEEVVSQVGEAAEVLNTGGSQMVSQVEQLKATDASYRGAGFTVQPAPKVELGPAHWAAIAAAGPFGPMLQAMFQARADEGTAQLATGLAVLTATDVATGASLTAAAEQLQPLEDKTGPGATDCLPVADEDGDGDPDRSSTDSKGDDGTKRTGDKTGDKDEDPKRDKDGKDGEKNDDDKKQEDEDKKDKEQDDPAEPETPGDRQPQDESTGEEDPGAEQPDAVQPEAPDFDADPIDTVDPNAPELPEYEPWDPSELGETEPPSGGLAGGGSGGGLGGGGGLGSTDLPSSGTGAGGGLIGASVGGGTPAATTATGGRPGMGGGLVGAPVARGAANPDNEVERESLLTEDPEEDVWGVGTAENNPYVDYLEEQEQASEARTPLQQDELPPLSLPGFELPDIGRS